MASPVVIHTKRANLYRLTNEMHFFMQDSIVSLHCGYHVNDCGFYIISRIISMANIS